MPALITSLIDKVDASELVRDEIAAILLTESAQQQVLATAAAKDPRLWKLRVFTERANPWAEFEAGVAQLDATPIVNVALHTVTFDGKRSNAVERQGATGTYWIDCIGYGVSADDGASGHVAGDAKASLEAQRAARLVRNILMAGHYAYLGTALRGTVGRRSIESITIMQPAMQGQAVENICGARIVFNVDFNEFSPQVQGQLVELIAGTVNRGENGELYFRANYQFPV